MIIIGTIILILISERSVPYGVWGIAGMFSEKSEREFITAYGLVSFPRTAFGASLLISSVVSYFFPGIFADVMFVLSLVCHVLTILFDTLRAAR